MVNEQGLSNKVKWGPGIANSLLQMVYSPQGAYLTFFITDVCLLSAGMMGTISLISSISTIFLSFLWGAIFQYSNTKSGRYRPWLLILPVFVFIGYAMMFFNWKVNPVAWSTLIILGYFISTLGRNGLSVANFSLITKIGKDEAERKGMALILNGLHTTVRIISAAIILPFIILVGGSNTAPGGYFAWFAGFSFLTFFGYLYFNRVSKPYDTYDPNFKAGGTRVTPADVFRTLGENHQLLMFFVFQFVCEFLFLCKTLGMVYFLRYICKNFPMYAVFTTLSPFGGLLATFLAAAWIKKTDKINMTVTVFVAQIIIYVAVAAIAFVTGDFNVYAFVALMVIGDFLNGIQRAINPLYYMDMTEYSFNTTGKDITPIVMAMQGLPFGFGFMASGSIVGAVLAASGYVANAVQTKSAINGIILAVLVIPCFGLIEFIIVLKKGYKLNKAKMTQIYEENANKRTALKAAETQKA